MAIKKRAVASAASEKSAEGVVKINSVEEPKAKQKAEAAVVAKKDETAKKPAAKKTAAKKSATAKPIEKKAAAAAAKKPAAKKTAAVKETAAEKKAPAAKKPAAPKKEAAKKPAAKAAAVQTNITVEFGGHDVTKETMDKAFEGVWTYDVNRKLSEVKSVDYYFKPEESAVYYVTNDGTEGRFEV